MCQNVPGSVDGSAGGSADAFSVGPASSPRDLRPPWAARSVGAGAGAVGVLRTPSEGRTKSASETVRRGWRTPGPEHARANAVLRPRREDDLRVPVGTDSRWEHGGNRRPLTRSGTQDALRRFGSMCGVAPDRDCGHPNVRLVPAGIEFDARTRCRENESDGASSGKHAPLAVGGWRGHGLRRGPDKSLHALHGEARFRLRQPRESKRILRGSSTVPEPDRRPPPALPSPPQGT